MKKITINPIVARRVWVAFGSLLLLRMSMFFQWTLGPFLYFDEQHPAYPYVFGRCFPFVLSIVCFFLAYHQTGKKYIFFLSCSIAMLIIGITFASMNVEFVWLIISFSFAFNFLPLIFFIYAAINIHREYFPCIFLALTTLCAGLEAYYTKISLHYGVQFQGINFIHHSIVKNIIFFSLIYILTGIYCKTRNIAFLHVAILLFCITISIVAFPWLGESI
ncbi:MAG: hypothetical protein V4496_04780 [Pseudomonadota bacterium]